MEKKGCSIFESAEFDAITTGLELAQCMSRSKTSALDPDTILPEVSRQLEDLVVADAHSCSCCSVKFPSSTAQRAHFKLDWHRFNIKRQLAGLAPVREEAFTILADQGDDLESISGSESESEDDVDKSDQVPSRHAKVFFRNHKGQVISIYRCLLFSSKDCPETELFTSTALELAQNDKWAVIMLGGGHFAASIFKGPEPIVHKTFHCYTVRAKQGGSQSTRDSKGGSHPKSAGASLRRYNEQALVQHVQDLIATWSDHIKACNIIFFRAVGPHNRSVLFGGKSPPLDKTDTRLRTIPFPTRRATFNEVKRVHGMLSFIDEHGPESEFQLNYPPSPERKYVAAKEEKTGAKTSDNEADKEGSPRRSKNKGGTKPNRAKSRPSPQRPLPANFSRTSSESGAPSGSDVDFTYEEEEIKLNQNLDMDQLMKNEVKKKVKKEKSKSQKPPVNSLVLLDTRSKEEILKEEKLKAQEAERKTKLAEKKARKQAAAELRKQLEEEEAAGNPVTVFQKELKAALQSCDVHKLQTCLSPDFLQTLPSELPGGLEQVINLPLLEGNTALHVASKSEEPSLIRVLMRSGADPSTRNKKCQTPYGVAVNKDIKKAFQDFMMDHPDKYDYSETQIPLPRTEEEEKAIAERKAAQKKLKRENEKKKLKKKAEEKAEQDERGRFMAMSDREKRALAAERRILAAQRRGTLDESKRLVLTRCFICGLDISGEVAFEYEQYRFCTIECLRAHRKQTNPESKIVRL